VPVMLLLACKGQSLTDTTIYKDGMDVATPITPERLAWGVVLMAFAVFCVIFLTATIGLYYFFFQSSIPMQTTLQVGRGIVGVREAGEAEQSERSHRSLSRGVTITTDRADSLSQASISFHDPNQESRLIAIVTLKSDTSLRVRAAARPRFEWASGTYQIDLLDFSGELDVYIAEALGREIEVNIRTLRGTWIALSDSGRYVASATDSQTRLTNRQGEAVIISPDQSVARSVPEGQRAIISSTLQGTITMEPVTRNLLANSELQTFTPAMPVLPQETSDSLQLPIDWSCTLGSNLPRGHYRTDYAPDGRPGFRMVRGEGATSHGEVRCEQRIGNSRRGVDVTGFDRLSLQTTLYINYQSLSVCGVEASECPLMLRIDYVDINGVEREWYRGIYARLDPGEHRFRCDSCFQEHVLIHEKIWYIFDSGNLFEVIPSEARPASISDVIFYASGHQYDVFVSDIVLNASQTPAFTDENNNANGAINQNGG
jgi:hypothetical protein